ncbi:thiosulfate oxidation carrier protein SoxY [Denitromonas iodatirespirans]|uniref:Thiosulfate oxidation carrier protein SoxY n=1 Tax=Denitromonas iodatirespirans TaxID=2795389 RepID=A0A944DA20_DENI1|nr:thiosulfate oxidation carrier protein SoxY [Denitromonas iodatirespirans]MBT0961191.1 thiosulfate oxidation carrier protein SoxY [Denitromonas iodatirespirans]
MDQARRRVLKGGGAVGVLTWLGAAGVVSFPAHAAEPVFAIHGVAAVMEALGAAGATESAAVEIHAAEIVENGAMVPVEVVSRVPASRQIALLVDQNPTTLAALFDLPEGTAPQLQTRIKMAKTSHVIALVEAEGGFHVARREIKIVQGGCA